MRLSRKFPMLFLLASLTPLLLAGWRLTAEMGSSLRQASLTLQRSMAERAAASVKGYLDNLRNVMLASCRAPGFLGDRTARRALLESLLDNHPPFADLAVFDDARRELDALSRFRRRNPFVPDWEQAAPSLTERGLYVGGAPQEEGYPALEICVPLENASGAQAGVFAARVNLLDMGALLGGLDLGTGGSARVKDARGRIVAGSGSPPDGPTLAVEAPIPGAGWTVTLEQPAAAVFRLMNQARRKIRVYLVGAFLLAAGLGLLTARALARPLREVRQALKGMREGHFDAALTGRSADEVGDLVRELKETRAEIEKKVRQATLGLLAHRVGHDLRQPLTAIRHSLEVVLRHAPGADEVALKHAGLIRDEIRRGADYVEDILTLGRDRAPVLRPSDLNAFVRRALEARPSREDLRMDFTPADPSLPCLIDDVPAGRALANVLSNAEDAVAPGGRILVETGEDGPFAFVRVSDDGRGMPPEERERVFDDFYTTKPHGTGLGMGIVKKVMDIHGGQVRLESAPERGTRVTLLFPSTEGKG